MTFPRFPGVDHQNRGCLPFCLGTDIPGATLRTVGPERFLVGGFSDGEGWLMDH
jgi:hypothetical protein